MQPRPPQQNTVLEAFGKALGLLCAFFTTMPAYDYSYAHVYRYALKHSPWEYLWFWEYVYILFVFFAIMITVWMVLHTLFSIVNGILRMLLVLFTFWRH